MAITKESLLVALDQAWDEEDGFLGGLRSGVFKEAEGNAYVENLQNIQGIFPLGQGTISSALVKLIWFAPQFIEWQLERATSGEAERTRLQRIADKVHEAVAQVLGIP